mmetsp:Transcript_51960/g.62485  ORF Transcript_51960/g.62485 Transcript_51960/m.62485 type:complete len:470 (+) Transcript_51960:153-1562(+)|eukprot:CAMPEP_0172515854 /NCGR_PEP_ID=MMETSP1066-20121228/271442_1 /TAXON_ID=671091 /ORGANISM="Coscinodiscus wailesii, Strain CCMP2513" /LENGTH=469 /DNA_ID=CAMNT_0013297081 /DNA_START=142 /DNA_END=1551 /DNA_ORIENTATION=+
MTMSRMASVSQCVVFVTIWLCASPAVVESFIVAPVTRRQLSPSIVRTTKLLKKEFGLVPPLRSGTWSLSLSSSSPDDTPQLITRRDTLKTASIALSTTLAPLTIANGGASATETTTTITTPPTTTNPAAQSITIPKVTIGKSNLEISRTIQGYWQLAGGHGKYNPSEAVKNMRAHYDAGMTTLDTADIYGPSESIVGEFVGGEGAAVPCTKFCCYRFLDEIDRKEVRRRILTSCERLKVDKLPLVQYFWSNYDIKKYVDVGLMLTELKEEGLIREIGATNFDLPRLKELITAGVPIASHQVQLSALDRRPVQSGMAQWCAAENVKLIAFGTVGGGILSERYLNKPSPPSKEETNTASLRLYAKTAERFGSWDLVSKELLGTLDAVAREVRGSGRCDGVGIANVAQRYVLGDEGVAAILVGVRNRSHVEENVRTHGFELTQAEREAIDAVVNKRNGPKGDVWDIERGVTV